MQFVDLTEKYYNSQSLVTEQSSAVSVIQPKKGAGTHESDKAMFCGKCHKKERKKGHKEVCQPVQCDGSCAWKDCPAKKSAVNEVVSNTKAPQTTQTKIKEALKSGMSQSDFEKVFLELVKGPLEEKEKKILGKRPREDQLKSDEEESKKLKDDDAEQQFDYQSCLDALDSCSDSDTDDCQEDRNHLVEIRVKVEQIEKVVTEMSTVLVKLVEKVGRQRGMKIK